MALAGKVALVTGSSRKMGKAIALAYAKAGADIVLNGLSNRQALDQTAEEVRATGARVVACLADISDRSAVDRMVAQANAELGPVDILVNCTAPQPWNPFDKIPADEWNRVLSVVLNGAFNTTQAVLGGMLAQGRGTILNIIGVAGQTGRPDRAAVITAKTGLVGMTRALAIEYADRGITANAVSPAMIARERDPNTPPRTAEGTTDRFRLDIPVGRQGRQDEVAALCVFLSSEDARFITGQVYAINGGVLI